MFVDYLLGTADLKVPLESKSFLFNDACSDIQFSRIKTDGEELYFTVPYYKLKKIKAILDDRKYEIISINGFPRLLLLYKKRWGLAVGIILFLVILSMSTKIIWTFNISGNEKVSDEVIVDTLKELGCTYGTVISKVDFDMLCNDFLIKCPDIAWISVNMNGTHANVEVREVARGKTAENNYNNIIASCDAQIVQITAYSGKKQVAIGDVVKEGDLLISAIGSFGEGRNKIEGADGLVLAETTKEFIVEIPYVTERKVFTGNTEHKNKLKFFDFSINLFVNSGIPYNKYDKIIENNQIDLLGALPLPVWVETEISSEYYLKEIRLTEDEAKLMAVSQYKSRMRELSSFCEILNISTRHVVEGESYKIYCSVHCICDIAKASPIIIE